MRFVTSPKWLSRLLLMSLIGLVLSGCDSDDSAGSGDGGVDGSSDGSSRPVITPQGCDDSDIVGAFQSLVLDNSRSCKSCHGPGGSGDEWYYDGDVAKTWAKVLSEGYVSATPAQSTFLTKPLDPAEGGTEHNGGIVFGKSTMGLNGSTVYDSYLGFLTYYNDCIEKKPLECDTGSAGYTYTRYIEPLVNGSTSTSCQNCHTAAVGLQMWVQGNPCATMACMMEVGEVLLEDPPASPILTKIAMANTSQAVQGLANFQAMQQQELDGVLKWIEFSAECHEEVCGSISNPCNAATAPPAAGVLNPLGACDEQKLTQVFQTRVVDWRGRCQGCHAVDGASAGIDPFEDNDPENDPPACANGQFPTGKATLFYPPSSVPPENRANFTFWSLISYGLLNPADPWASKLLTKPLKQGVGQGTAAGICHGGGAKVRKTTDCSYQDFGYAAAYYAACYNGQDPTQIPVPDCGVPVVTITTPDGNARYGENKNIPLKAEALNQENGVSICTRKIFPADVIWTATPISGGAAIPLAQGPCKELQSISHNTLTPGVYTLTASVAEVISSKVGTASITLTILNGDG